MPPQPARLRVSEQDSPIALWGISEQDSPIALWGIIAVSLLADAASVLIKAYLASWVWSRFVATHFGVPALPASAVMGLLIIFNVVRTLPKSEEPPTWDTVRNSVSREIAQIVIAAGLALVLLPFAG